MKIKINQLRIVNENKIHLELNSILGSDLNFKKLIELLQSGYIDLAFKLYKYLKLDINKTKEISIIALKLKKIDFIYKISMIEFDLLKLNSIINLVILFNEENLLNNILKNFSNSFIKYLDQNSSFSSLAVAILNNNIHILNILLKYPFDVNKMDERFDTPLMVAASCEDSVFVRSLIDNGSNIGIIAKDGFTPVLVALSQLNVNYELIDYLLYNGASFIEVYNYFNNEEIELIKSKLNFFQST